MSHCRMKFRCISIPEHNIQVAKMQCYGDDTQVVCNVFDALLSSVNLFALSVASICKFFRAEHFSK